MPFDQKSNCPVRLVDGNKRFSLLGDSKMVVSSQFSLEVDLHPEYCAENSGCNDDGVRGKTESANAEGPAEHFLADGRPTGESGRRNDGDPPRKAEHYFL